MRVDWATFKNFIDTRKLSPQFIEYENTYYVAAADNFFTLTTEIDKATPAGSAQSEFENDYIPIANKSPITNVITALEKDDKSLGLISMEATFTDNVASLELEIPGTPGGVGLYIKEGYAFTDVFNWGIRVEDVKLVDKNFLYAGVLYPATPTETGIPGVEGLSWVEVMPNGLVLGDYCDAGGVDSENRGWRFWADESNQGGADIDNLAGYGELLAGCFLVIKITKPVEAATTTKVAVNLQTGVPT